MIRELAEVLGLSDDRMFYAVQQAAERAGWQPGHVVIVTEQQEITYHDGMVFHSRPSANVVLVAFGPPEKMAEIVKVKETERGSAWPHSEQRSPASG